MDCQEVKRIKVGRNPGINLGMSLIDTILKLKLTCFGHVVWSDGLEKMFMFGMGNG